MPWRSAVSPCSGTPPTRESLRFTEFDAPFRLVARIADQLEHALTGTDKY